MDLTSTILKIDLAVLSVLLGVMIAFFKCLQTLQQKTAEAAQERGEIHKTLEFHDRRLNSIENWISSNSELRRGRS